jgi:hypothetical protein
LKHEGDISNVKLIDFGLAQDFSENAYMKNAAGSVKFNTSNLLPTSPTTQPLKF